MVADFSFEAGPVTEGWFEELAKDVLSRRRIPRVTYRLQLNRSFRFEDAVQIVPYLQALGISDVYASPLLKAGRKSDHGYDITDHGAFNPELGSEADFESLTDELRRRGMGFVFDMVPNHMGIVGADNAWWMDVLENGPSSPYAPYFDVDWHPLKGGTDLDNRLLLPILGNPYGKVLENQELVLRYLDGAFFVQYYDWWMPLEPRTYAEILSARLGELAEMLGSDHDDVLELQSILTAINYLPHHTETDPEKVAERQREKEIVKRRIAKLADGSPTVRAAIDSTVIAYNGARGDPRSFDAMDALLDRQCYRLAFWRVAAEEINYRRFFDINELAAIRMERPEVFAATHRLVLGLIRAGKVTGLRIDHADGLWDPVGYLRQLQKSAFEVQCQDWLDRRFGAASERRAVAETCALAHFEAARSANPRDPLNRPLFVVVEKILSPDEELPQSWPVDGTTGYDFANLVNGLFVDSANQKAFTNLYAAFVHTSPTQYGNLVNSTKKIIMLVSLASEVNELGYQLKRIASKNRLYRDLTLNSLTHAIREVIADLPVYRTYLAENGERIDVHDLAAIEVAVSEARRRNPRTASAVFDFVQSVLTQRYPEGSSDEDRVEWDSFVMRFQQTTGPVMAKGVEDTAFYVYNRLVSLNEVGGNPERFGVSTTAFHQGNAERQRTWPSALITLSTHDSKRSADVRARLNVLSEVPGLWRSALVRWSRYNRSRRGTFHGQPVPDRNEEYLLYQTLLGAWPLEEMDDDAFREFRQRIQDYMQKALREAKVHTSWVNPNVEYDAAVARFIDAILNGRQDGGFLRDFRQFHQFIAFYGMLNSLSQTLLQLTAPGVPDVYQGNELWDFSLVDPDNRRPVDFQLRRRLLEDLTARIAMADRGQLTTGRLVAAAAGEGVQTARPLSSAKPEPSTLSSLALDLLANWRDGRVKLYLTQRVLEQRREHPRVYAEGGYVPLEVSGRLCNHVVAFARTFETNTMISVAPRLMVSITNGESAFPVGEPIWGDTRIQLTDGTATRFENVLTGDVVNTSDDGEVASILVADVLASFPVALLRKLAD